MSVERQQGGAYQGDLFDEALLKALRPGAPGFKGAEPEPGRARSGKRLRRWTGNEP